jgi:hypothetical protein
MITICATSSNAKPDRRNDDKPVSSIVLTRFRWLLMHAGINQDLKLIDNNIIVSRADRANRNINPFNISINWRLCSPVCGVGVRGPIYLSCLVRQDVVPMVIDARASQVKGPCGALRVISGRLKEVHSILSCLHATFTTHESRRIRRA